MDVRDDLERSTKFIYLVQSLEGEPKEMVSGLAITDNNYPIAVRVLRDRYMTMHLDKLMYYFRNSIPCQPLSSISLRIFEIS